MIGNRLRFIVYIYSNLAVSILRSMNNPVSTPTTPKNPKPLQTIKQQLPNNNICDGADTSLIVLCMTTGLCRSRNSGTLRSGGHLISGITPLQLEVVTLCAHCHGPKGTKATMAHRLTVQTKNGEKEEEEKPYKM